MVNHAGRSCWGMLSNPVDSLIWSELLSTVSGMTYASFADIQTCLLVGMHDH